MALPLLPVQSRSPHPFLLEPLVLAVLLEICVWHRSRHLEASVTASSFSKVVQAEQQVNLHNSRYVFSMLTDKQGQAGATTGNGNGNGNGTGNAKAKAGAKNNRRVAGTRLARYVVDSRE
jgi:hypothetical protein